jgi:hypothetical protein
MPRSSAWPGSLLPALCRNFTSLFLKLSLPFGRESLTLRVRQLLPLLSERLSLLHQSVGVGGNRHRIPQTDAACQDLLRHLLNHVPGYAVGELLEGLPQTTSLRWILGDIHELGIIYLLLRLAFVSHFRLSVGWIGVVQLHPSLLGIPPLPPRSPGAGSSQSLRESTKSL